MTTPRPKRRRRRFLQFSLRALLIFVLLVSVGMSWLATEMRQLAMERRACAHIGRLGAKEYPGPCGSPVWLFGRLTPYYVDFRETDISGRELACLAALPKLVGLELSSSATNDAGLETIGRLRRLKDLYLDGTQITDAGLRHLTGLKRLRYLNVQNTQVTPEGVRKLQEALPYCDIEY